jgi:hypothetical protein
VKHFASPAFWESYAGLPDNIRALADKSYALLKENPRHPSLQLEKIGRFWSVRVGIRYRALAVEVKEGGSGSDHMPTMTPLSQRRSQVVHTES